MDDVQSAMSKIRWETIRGNSGDCLKVPEAISLIRSGDPAQRKSAYWKLDNHIVVQGGLFEGAFYAIPFLLQICIGESHDGRIEATNLLFEIAAGTSRFDNRVQFSTIRNPFLHYIPDPNAAEVPIPIAVRFAVACGIPAIALNMASENNMERKRTRELLSLFPEYAFELSECLHPIAAESTNHQTKEDIFGLIHELGG